METQRNLMRSLAFVMVIVSVIWTTTAADIEVVYSCCTKVSTAVVTDPIIGIRLQRESSPCVNAIIFETERGNEQGIYFCSDPRPRWVQKKVKQFFTAQRNKGLTSTPPPTSSISDQTHAGGSTQGKARPANAEPIKVNSCCTKVSTSVVTDPIIGVRVQRENLPCVNAIIFVTERKDFCCDPRQRWVQKKVKEYFRKKNTTPPPTSAISA